MDKEREASDGRDLDLVLLNSLVELKYPNMTMANRCRKISEKMGRYYNPRARKMGYAHPKTIQKWLTGDQTPEPDALRLLAKLLECTVKQLCGQEYHQQLGIIQQEKLKRKQKELAITDEVTERTNQILSNLTNALEEARTLDPIQREFVFRKLLKNVTQVLCALSILCGIGLGISGYTTLGLIISLTGLFVCLLFLTFANLSKTAFVVIGIIAISNLCAASFNVALPVMTQVRQDQLQTKDADDKVKPPRKVLTESSIDKDTFMQPSGGRLLQ